MRLIYNGVELGILTLHEYTSEPVYEDSGVDWLYNRVHVSCTAVVNGAATVVNSQSADASGTSYRITTDQVSPFRVGDVGKETNRPPQSSAAMSVPLSVNASNHDEGVVNYGFQNARALVGDGITAGEKRQQYKIYREPQSAVLTERAIRFRLTTPRAPLWVYSGHGSEPGELILRSPAEGYHCDAKNGPVPKVWSVQQVMGDSQTFLVNFQIETFVREGTENGVHQSTILLSNRFSQTHELDETSHLTIHTAGLALFRTDWLYRLPQNPESTRFFLFMPVPKGFVRQDIKVEGLPDVTGVIYAYTDRQQHVHFAAGPYVNAVQIEAIHTQALVTDSDVLEGALGAYERALNINWLRNHGNTAGAERPPGRANAILGAPGGPKKPRRGPAPPDAVNPQN